MHTDIHTYITPPRAEAVRVPAFLCPHAGYIKCMCRWEESSELLSCSTCPRAVCMEVWWARGGPLGRLAPASQRSECMVSRASPLGPYHTYMHTYIHTYMHACIHTYMHAYRHTLHIYIHTNMHTYIHTCMHTCIHAYIHTYMHTYMNTYT